ncbi:Phosphoenolpyruvate carboxykinase (ATP) [Heracleum sosnowskyi]|uniref:phosphoenolpyruvate carboxykinase (ATP) n=1 Tax=Heracleum sosnowskyi TaxID=360622 RepID=A0AAD8HH33_9APIA|nr:Phosphoenolpyruvate carboxykinase (ATP) [Heracleum sosnowskyi]
MKRFAHFFFNKFNSPSPSHRYSARNIVSSSSEKDAVRSATREEHSSVPFLARGHICLGNSKISRSQFTKLLKQVTSYISSISELYVHDGAISSFLRCDAKVRVISDSPSSVLSLSKLLWRTPNRAVSHDTCPLTVYVASSISSSIEESLGIKGDIGFIAADTERSSLILCGKAFADANGIREALTALSEPIIISRGGLPLSAGLLVSRNLVMLLFAPEDILQNCSDVLVSPEAGVVVSSEGVSPLFQIGNSGGQCTWKFPSVVILASSDSSGTIPSILKLTPGQAAYHFLVGYQDGKFTPTYSKNSSVDPLELAKGLLSMLQENQISSFLINVNGEKTLKTGTNLVNLVQSALQENIQPIKMKGGDLRRKYKSFLSNKFKELPKEFSF